MSDLQRLYGLVVAAEFPLHQDRPVPAGTPVDVHVRWGRPVAAAVQQDPVEGTVLLLCPWEDEVGYVFVERPDGTFLLRFVGTCDFEVSADLGSVVVRPVEGADPGIAVVLTTGAMLAFQLSLRGSCVLHASAVEVDGSAIAFVADSGGGKSTMAGLLCADGAALVTDDVLVVDGLGSRPTVRLGATELRLRKGADTLVERFLAAPERRTSADDRQVLQPPGVAADGLGLEALVLPVPDRTTRALTVERLAPKAALLELLALPRLLGWQDPRVLGRALAHLSALVGGVPVYRATVPWGPPFPDDVAAQLTAAIRERVG